MIVGWGAGVAWGQVGVSEAWRTRVGDFPATFAAAVVDASGRFHIAATAESDLFAARFSPAGAVDWTQDGPMR